MCVNFSIGYVKRESYNKDAIAINGKIIDIADFIRVMEDYDFGGLKYVRLMFHSNPTFEKLFEYNLDLDQYQLACKNIANLYKSELVGSCLLTYYFY